jgi:broad specificity phosphatase PhoE
MFERARPFVAELLEHEARRVAVVSHGMIGKVMMSILLDLGEEETLDIYQPNDAVIRISIDGEGVEVHHWRDGIGPAEGFTKRDW